MGFIIKRTHLQTLHAARTHSSTFTGRKAMVCSIYAQRKYSSLSFRFPSVFEVCLEVCKHIQSKYFEVPSEWVSEWVTNERQQVTSICFGEALIKSKGISNGTWCQIVMKENHVLSNHVKTKTSNRSVMWTKVTLTANFLLSTRVHLNEITRLSLSYSLIPLAFNSYLIRLKLKIVAHYLSFTSFENMNKLNKYCYRSFQWFLPYFFFSFILNKSLIYSMELFVFSTNWKQLIER